MKVLLLADINSIHTQRWATALKSRGIEIAVFTINRLKNDSPRLTNIPVFNSDNFKQDISYSGLISKIKYLTILPSLKKCIRAFAPDIVHAHYASSFGTLGAFCGFHPFILSVWGSDIFDFPGTSPLAKWLIRYNLKKADRILSTSHIMATETRKYTGKNIEITPFGIDLNKFKRYTFKNLFEPGSIVIGTIKALEKKYGIGYLIEVFGKLRSKYPALPLKLLIVGSGSIDDVLKEKTRSLGLENDVIFTGSIPHEIVPDYLNMLDIYSALSILDSESFGVAIIEASACGLPVVVTNVGGLKEVVVDGQTGLLVPPKNIDETVVAFEKLLFNKELRTEMGIKGRQRINQLYNWDDNVDEMMKIYGEF